MQRMRALTKPKMKMPPPQITGTRKGQPNSTARELPLRDYVQSLERGLAVIRSLGGGRGLTLAEVARITGITRAAARRFLLTLETLGYVGRSDTGFYLLPKTLELGYSYLSSQSLAQIAQPHLQRLAKLLGESCSVTLLDRHSIIYVARVTVNRLVGANLSVGSTLPAYCTSAGRVLLASLSEADLSAYMREVSFTKLTPKTINDVGALRKELERTRRQGWCLINEELEIGARAISVPLHDRSGRTIAALNVSCYAGRVQPKEMIKTFLPNMLVTAKNIDSEMCVIGNNRD
jgi:IclR family pca regulon transcriptional regulator